MKVAVIGAGVSGLVTAYRLAPEHEVSLFEAGSYPGGHTNTVDVEIGGRALSVDTGFIVYNPRTYPNFCGLIEELGVPWVETVMSFGAHCPLTGFEYGTEGLMGWIARPANLLDRRLYALLRDIFKFFKVAKRDLAERPEHLAALTLAEFVAEAELSDTFREFYIVPMTAAVWSAPASTALQFPALTLLRFLDNHGLLSASEAPIWRTIVGGSREYVRAMLARYRGQLHLNTPVQQVRRSASGVELQLPDGSSQQFDQLVIASHSDQALALLADPSDAEREVLGGIAYQPNQAILHTDAKMLPKHKAAWAAWNCRMPSNAEQPTVLSYDMNRLQHLPGDTPIIVTLNAGDQIDPQQILRRIDYAHPVYTQATVAAQARWAEISGVEHRTWYCGAYWFNGFHEDGVRSALRVVDGLTQQPAAPAAA